VFDAHGGAVMILLKEGKRMKQAHRVQPTTHRNHPACGLKVSFQATCIGN